ncbi:hypothetical protein LSTR_LSTR009316 [Laodelphax striatellus]|uniref:Uncharacterized protein n=1 Tax=Laodelphax striatellus TaxID=195883 RepID=A0A482XHD7_LAOST|nr:hypothetical protein LSTR_LSTR009316 [Laodelphax striatellus]
MKNEEMNFRLGKSVTDRGNNLRNEYLHSTRRDTSIGYGLFVRSDYFKNINSSKYSTSKLDNLKSSYPAQNNSFNTYYSTHKTSIDPNHNSQKNKESQIEKYQVINTENKNQNYDHYADRIKYLIMGDEKVIKVNQSQNAIAISSLAPSSFTKKEQNMNSLQIPVNPPHRPDTMIVDQHTRIMLQMNHEINREKLLNSFGKKEKFEDSIKNSTVNNSIDNTRTGQKNLILNIRNDLGKNGSYGQNMNHEDQSRFLYENNVGRPPSNNHEIHNHYSNFEPYSNSHMNSNAMYECKTCRVNSQQIYSPMTNHMRDVVNKNTNSGQGNVVPTNVIRHSPQGYNPGGFKANTTTNKRVVVNNPNKYDSLSSNSMTVNKFEMGAGMNPNVMNPHNIKAGVGMESHPMQPNKHPMDSFVMHNINHNKQELAPVSHNSMKQNMYTVNENGYSYIPPNSYHVNVHDQHDVNNVNEEHMMMPYNYKIPNNMMHKPHVGLHSQNDGKEYMVHHNHEVQSSMMSKPHSETQDNHVKDNMMKEHYYHYDKPSTELAKPQVEAHVQNVMEKGNFMEQMMMLMMMKFGDHMAPNNVINFHVAPDNMKMEPMMKFNRIHPMLPMMMRPPTSAMPDKKEEEKYALVKHPEHDKKEDEKYVIVKMPSKPEEIIDHSYISYSPFSWISGWYPGLIFPDKKKIFTVIFLIVVVILAKKLLLALAVIKFFLAIVPVLAFILLLKKYLLFLLITKGLKFFKKFKKVPHLLAVSPLFFFPIIIPFFYLCKGGESSSTEYTITYPTFTYPTFTFPTFTFPTFVYPTSFPTNPETTGRTDTPHTFTTTTTTTTLTTLTTTTTMATTMTTNTDSMATETMSMATHPMSMATHPMSMSSPSMSSPSMSMASPPMSMATQAMTMSGRIGVVQPTIRPVPKTTLAMKITGNRIKVKHTKLPALTQYTKDINSYKFKPYLKKTTPMSNVSTDKKLSTSTYQNNKKHPLRWHGVTKKPKPTKSMDKLVTSKQKTSTYNRNCGGNKIPCKNIKKNTPGVKVKDQKYKQNNSSYYSKIGSLQNKNKPVSMKNIITNRDKQKLKIVLQNGAIAKTSNLNKRKNKTYESEQIVDENNLEDLSNGIEILRERFPRQSSSFLSLFNRMWSALASDRCMERIGCHLAVNSKSVRNYNSLILRVLQSLFSRRANRRIRSYIKAYQLGSKKEGSHFMCRYLFPCLGILKI